MKERQGNLPTLRQLLARGHLRLILFAVILASAFMAIGGILLARGYVQRNLDLVARTVSYTVEPALVFGDKQALEESIASVVRQKDVDRVEVVADDGGLLGQWERGPGGFAAGLEDAANGLVWPEPATLDVRRGGQHLATVRVFGSSRTILDFAARGLVIALCCIGLTILATRILARRLEDEIIEPIRHVADVAHAVRKDREFDRRVGHSGILEVDRFATDFNALLAQLQGWHLSMVAENAELAHRAAHDPLTGLGNRDLFERALDEAVGQSAQKDTSFAVLFIDVDEFKLVNDDFGHDEGDVVLAEIARRLRESIRADDQAFRLGGDEFAIILNPLFDSSLVQTVIARIQACIARPVILECGEDLAVNLSIGFAIYPTDGFDAKAILRRADAGMYRNKRLRREGRTMAGDLENG